LKSINDDDDDNHSSHGSSSSSCTLFAKYKQIDNRYMQN